MPEVRKKGFAEMVPSGMRGPKDKEKMHGGSNEEHDSRIKPKNYQVTPYAGFSVRPWFLNVLFSLGAGSPRIGSCVCPCFP